MSDQQVVYQMSLKDHLTRGVEGANAAVNKLESSLGGVGKILGSLGVAFGIFEGIKFLREGVEEAEKFHQAEAQLQNTMQNMGTYSKEAMEGMVDNAVTLSQAIKFSRSEIIGLQSQLSLVGNIGEDVMQRMTVTAANMATKFHMGLDEAGNMLAKGVNDPMMARRLGMLLKIDPAKLAYVKELAKDGKEAEARLELVSLAEEKVQGAALAAFNADPLARFNKIMGSVKLTIGEAAIALLKQLTPALEWMANALKNTIAFLKEHWQLIKNITIAIGSAWVAMKLFAGSQIIIAAISFAMQGLAASAMGATSGMAAFTAALDVNPIFLAATAIGAVVFAMKAFNDETERNQLNMSRIAGEQEDGMIEKTKQFYVKQGLTEEEAMKKAKERRKAVLRSQIDDINDQMKHIPTMSAAGLAGALDPLVKKRQELEAHLGAVDKSGGLIPYKGAKSAAASSVTPPKEPKTKATGSKSVTINVTIKELIHDYTNVINNKMELGNKIKEHVVAALTGAVNDFQVVAGNS